MWALEDTIWDGDAEKPTNRGTSWHIPSPVTSCHLQASGRSQTGISAGILRSEGGEARQLLRAQLKVEDVEVLLEVASALRLGGEGHAAVRQVPEPHLVRVRV